MNILRILTFLFLTVAANAQNARSIFDVLSYDEALSVNIDLDLTTLTSDLRNEDKHEATLSFKDADGIAQQWDMKVKLRGKYRRMKCTDTPPLKLYFDKTDLANAGLAKHNDLKLVNFCYEDKEIAQDLLVKEYLAYQMYAAITDVSYRVQLLKITYKDTATGDKIKQWGFIIEDTAQVRNRIAAKKLAKEEFVDLNQFNREQTKTVSLFQYMIGNADWRLDIRKNVNVVKQNGQLIAIPYDFDFSGFVNPPYATVNSNFNLTSVKDRVYLGFPEDVLNINPTIDLFQTKKKELYKLVKIQKHLSWDSKVEIFTYLDEFYDNLNAKTIVRAIPIEKNLEKGLTSAK